MPRRKSFSSRLGARLRARRQARGWSQAKLAESVGVTPNYVGILERGEKLPTLDTLVALSRALDVSPADLLDDDRGGDPWIDDIVAVAKSVRQSRRAVALAVLRAIATESE